MSSLTTASLEALAALGVVADVGPDRFAAGNGMAISELAVMLADCAGVAKGVDIYGVPVPGGGIRNCVESHSSSVSSLREMRTGRSLAASAIASGSSSSSSSSSSGWYSSSSSSRKDRFSCSWGSSDDRNRWYSLSSSVSSAGYVIHTHAIFPREGRSWMPTSAPRRINATSPAVS